MKARTNKLISLALVLVMLASMIPMGMISANATELDPNATEYVITSVDDWNAVAALKDLTNKTIKLGADIDAQGAVLPRFGNFVGTTFDGCDYTISNANNTRALITDMFYNNSVIKNVKLDKVTVTGAAAAKDVGLIVTAASFDAGNTKSTIENVIATNCSVTATGSTNVGGLIGRISLPKGEMVVNDLSFSGTITADGMAVGGIIGLISNNVGITLDGIYVDATFNVTRGTTAADSSSYEYATGGVVGRIFTGANFPGDISLKNVYVTGTLNAAATVVAGVVGFAHIQGGNMNWNNVAVNIGTYGWTANVGTSIFANLRHVFNVNYQNLYCNYGGYNQLRYMFDLWQGNNYIKINGSAFMNGNFVYGNGYQDILNTHLAQYDGVEGFDLVNVVKVDGYDITVMDHIYASAIQFSQVENGEFAVRFIAMAQRTEAVADNVTMTVVATTSGGAKKKFVSECTLYDALTEYSEKGIKGAKTAAEYNAQKLAGLTIYGIPANDGETVTFEVTTSYTAKLNGRTVIGTHTMTVTFLNGQLVEN